MSFCNSGTSFSRTWIWLNSTLEAMRARTSASLMRGRNILLKISMDAFLM